MNCTLLLSLIFLYRNNDQLPSWLDHIHCCGYINSTFYAFYKLDKCQVLFNIVTYVLYVFTMLLRYILYIIGIVRQQNHMAMLK